MVIGRGKAGQGSVRELYPVPLCNGSGLQGEFSCFTLAGIRKFHGWTHASLSLVLDHLSTVPKCDYVREVPGFGLDSHPPGSPIQG